jgi:hypothetical protein
MLAIVRTTFAAAGDPSHRTIEHTIHEARAVNILSGAQSILRGDKSYVEVGLGRAVPALSCFVLLRVVSFRHGRHIEPCRYGTVNLFFGPSTTRGTLARLRIVPAQARLSKYLYQFSFSTRDMKYIYISCVYYFNKSLIIFIIYSRIR